MAIFFKKVEDSQPILEQEGRMLPHKIKRTRNKTVILGLCKCQAKDFFSHFSKADKKNKTADVCFQCETHLKFKIKNNSDILRSGDHRRGVRNSL